MVPRKRRDRLSPPQDRLADPFMPPHGQAEEIVNKQIQRDLPVDFEIVTVDEAKKRGAIGVFPDRYDEKVKVYRMGDFSYEICGGPHVPNTGTLKKFKITKEEASSAGIRRVKAVLV